MSGAADPAARNPRARETPEGREEGAAAAAAAWLEPRLRDVSAELADAVRLCLERASREPPAESAAALLSRAALEEFDRVLELPQDRTAAVRLLAADASLTYAFEAAAELGDDVTALADRIGTRGRLGRRVRKLASARAPESGSGPAEDGT